MLPHSLQDPQDLTRVPATWLALNKYQLKEYINEQKYIPQKNVLKLSQCLQQDSNLETATEVNIQQRRKTVSREGIWNGTDTLAEMVAEVETKGEFPAHALFNSLTRNTPYMLTKQNDTCQTETLSWCFTSFKIVTS